MHSIRLDSCHHLGRETAEVFASIPCVQRCSLSMCRPMPEAAQFWEDPVGRAQACGALGIDVPVLSVAASACNPDDPGEDGRPLPSFGQRGSQPSDQTVQEAATCAMCLDEIGRDEAVWECPVCCNKLHDTDDCARGWLRLKQSCPTCRAAAWAPPEDSGPVSRMTNATSRRRPTRAASADGLAGTPRSVMSSPTAGLQDLSGLSGLSVGLSVGAFRPVPRSLGHADHSAASTRDPVPPSVSSGRPPRPTAMAARSTPPSLAISGQSSASRCPIGHSSAASRARSVPSSRQDGGRVSGRVSGLGMGLGGLSLVGSSIVGTAR